MHSQALEELFVQELEELYDAEKQIYRGLSLLARSAGNADLIMAFRNHQKETKSQTDRLKKSFALLGEKPHRGRASGVAGFIRQTREMARQPDFDSAVIDAGLAASAEKIQKYQLAAYGCLLTHAGLLGYREIEELIAKSLKEEEAADALLRTIAEKEINRAAAAAPYASARKGPRHDASGTIGETLANHGKLGLGTVAIGLVVGGLLSFLMKPRPVVP
jgi:ferritin-like metal-binding protein YciE